jgi:CheY-like chemotaxis protein
VTQPGGGALLTGEAVSELRHELRTPVNHIVGYAEMLLEDVEPGQAVRRSALEETLGAARDVLTIIGTSLPPGQSAIAPTQVSALYDSLRAPQQRILRALTPLLEASQSDDDEFTADVRRIVNAAERLGSAPASVEAAVAAAPAPAPKGSNAALILVVDDVEDNREVLRRRLERQGHAVECAEGGQAALDMVNGQPYDLVLLDVLMPEIDGYEVLQRIKQSPATRDIPVIMISALDELDSIVRCIESGAEDYLPKPFDPVLLRARITACLEKKRLRDLEVEYLRQVARVIEAATAVESGTYRTDALADVAQRSDELGRLARVFDTMAAEVRNREERLRQQIDDLKSEVSAARTAKRASGAAVNFASLATGQQFAVRYEVLETVGAGAMGMVYRARDLELDEEIAIKTVKPELVVDATAVERFKDEIRLARRISHRNVVRTHDLGEWQGVYYLTMEYVEGVTVRDLLDTRGRLDVSPTLAIASQLAAALDVAHQQGVIHRDIKPQNLLLDGDGVLKVMDFGVARLAERTNTITETGLVVGTPAYMSPEQLLTESDIDPRSDLYAVGVVLYECLTGQLPFEARTPVSLIAKVLNEEPDAPHALNPEVPAPLSALVGELLGKRPDDRPASARELEERLAHFG